MPSTVEVIVDKGTSTLDFAAVPDGWEVVDWWTLDGGEIVLSFAASQEDQS